MYHHIECDMGNLPCLPHTMLCFNISSNTMIFPFSDLSLKVPDPLVMQCAIVADTVSALAGLFLLFCLFWTMEWISYHKLPYHGTIVFFEFTDGDLFNLQRAIIKSVTAGFMFWSLYWRTYKIHLHLQSCFGSVDSKLKHITWRFNEWYKFTSRDPFTNID